jgi:hypothetical protein
VCRLSKAAGGFDSHALPPTFSILLPFNVFLPGSRYDRRVAECAGKSGYRMRFTSKPGFLRAGPGADFASGRFLVKAGWDMGKFKKVMKCGPFTLDRLKAVYAGELWKENKNS